MLRTTLIASFVLAATANAQSITPTEREPVYTKEDIFGKLAPLAPAKTAEAPPPAAAIAPSPTNSADDEQAIQENGPATTLAIRPPQTVEGPAPAATAPPRSSFAPAATSHTPVPLSPKLQAMLRPAAQRSGQPPAVPAHAPGAMTALSAEELRTLIGYVADDFRQQLGRLKHGERWQTYLRLEELEAACRVGADLETVEKLPAIGLRFASLASNPKYNAVTQRNNFQTLHLALGEFLSLDDERGSRQRLLGSVEAFERALAPVGTGVQWAGYFELAALRRLGASPQPFSEHDLVQLQLILARFEQAATDEQYSALAKLEGFDATQAAIRATLGVQRRPTAEAVAAAQPEAAVAGEVTIPDDASSQLAQASATVERLPLAGEGLQLVALGGKAFIKQQSDAGWKQIGTAAAAPGDAISARDEAAQLTLGQSFALQLAEQTTATFAQRDVAGSPVTQLSLAHGTVKAIANGRSGGGETLYLAAGDYQFAVSGDDFAVELQVEQKKSRVVAIVHAGQVAVENNATGDTAVVRAGREAVLLAGGIALRAAPPKSADWWPAPADHPRSARRDGGGFSQ